MTTTRHVTVWCDAPDCGAWIGQEDSAADARKYAKDFGWVRRNGRDLCPEHADGGQR